MLFVCAGPLWDGDVEAAARGVGVSVFAIDPLRAGEGHDVTRDVVLGELRTLCLRPLCEGVSCVVAAHMAPPCRSFSPLNKWRGLRTRSDPDGRAAPVEYGAYIERENAIIAAVVEVADILLAQGRTVTFENPPDRRAPGQPWHWAEMEHMASLWVTPAVRGLAEKHALVCATAPMCIFGSEYLKYFTLLAPPWLAEDISWLASSGCPGTGEHARHTPARGRSASGDSHARLAGRYPLRMNEWLLSMLARSRGGCLAVQRRRAGSSTDETDATSDGESGDDPAGPSAVGQDAPAHLNTPDRSVSAGWASTGPQLDALVRARVEEERRHPAGFASLRNRSPASPDELDGSPLPDVWEMARQLAKESEMRGGPQSSRLQWTGRGDWRDLVQGAPTGRVTLRMLIGEEKLVEWTDYLQRTQQAFDDVRAGRRPRSPGDFVLRASCLPQWAQRFVWDTGCPEDCRPVLRSDRHTVFPGPRQLNRARFRDIAGRLAWHDVDPDILDQVGEGGAELRSEAPLHTTASWHHPGVAEHWEHADAAVREEREHEWTRVCSSSPLPFVPCVFSPRDVVLQERARLVNGELEIYLKPRVTHDMSSVPRELGGRQMGISANSGIPRSQKGISVLPRAQHYARAQAICARAGEGGAIEAPYAGVYGVDKKAAYCFCPVQQAEHYAGCYLWVDGEGRVRPHVSTRMVFGGASWPNRFERISLLDSAWVIHKQREFDSRHPLPPEAQRWAAMRRDLQSTGALPAGEAQIWPGGMEPYIDDLSGRALLDRVPTPPHLVDISIGADQTAAVGCRPAPDDSRLAVHCRIATHELSWLGWEIPPEKTMCGDGMLLLGALLDGLHQCVRCPRIKQEWVMHAVRRIRQELQESARVDVDLIQRFTGRLTNLSQYFPELRCALAVGYSLSRGRWARMRRHARDGVRWLRLNAGGNSFRELLDLLDISAEVISDNVGVAMAPSMVFDDLHAAGTLTVVTDASRADVDDGYGGYAFVPDMPEVVFLMSAPWAEKPKAAIDAAASARAVRRELGRRTSGLLSMPAGEVFAALALAAAVASHLDRQFQAVVAIGDCLPASRALSRRASRSPQMRRLVAWSAASAPRWLGVCVPREWNLDADCLSHPSQFELVRDRVVEAGLVACRVRTPSAVLSMLEEVVQLPLGRDDAAWESCSFEPVTAAARG